MQRESYIITVKGLVVPSPQPPSLSCCVSVSCSSQLSSLTWACPRRLWQQELPQTCSSLYACPKNCDSVVSGKTTLVFEFWPYLFLLCDSGQVYQLLSNCFLVCEMRGLIIHGGGGGLVAKSCPTLATPWTVACQLPLTMGIL